MTTRRSKIARLPRDLRIQISERLQDGQAAAEILDWLNALPAVQAVLLEHFEGRLINEPNLSEWKKRGHQDWLRLQHSQELAERLAEQSEILKDTPDGRQHSERFATLLALEFSRLAEDLLAGEMDPKERFERLCQINRELSRLRRDEDRAACTRLREQENAQKEAEAQREEKRQTADQRRDELMAPMNALLQFNPLAEKMGGGDWAHAAAAYITEAQNGLTMGHFGYKNPLTVRYKPQYAPDELKLSRTRDGGIQGSAGSPIIAEVKET